MENNKRTQGEWIADNSAIIKMITPAGSFDNGKLTIAKCYSTIEGNSFEYKHLHPEIEKAFEENPLLMEKVITDKMAKANATFICEAVNNYDKLKEDNALLLSKIKELLRFNSLMISAADNLQYPDNYLNAIEDCKEAIQKAESK